MENTGCERDSDGDGVVSREEAERVRLMIFAQLDGNGDGVISTQEIVARQQLMQMRSELRQSRLALAAARNGTESGAHLFNGSILY